MSRKVSFTALITVLIAFGVYVYLYPPIQNKNTIYMNYEEPINKLSNSLIINMVENYKDNQLKYINESLQIDDSRATWFDLETLKKFIYHIEVKAKNNTEKPIFNKNLGIRLYYASYPSAIDDSISKDPIFKKQTRHHTVILIPTRKEGDLIIDFDPDNPETYTKSLNEVFLNQIKLIKKENDSVPLLYSIKNSNSLKEVSGLNHSAGFPPYSLEGAAFFEN